MRFSKTWRYLRLQNFLSREGKIVYLYLKSNWNSNFTKLSTAETKILTTSQTKNAQARRTSSFGIFTSPRPILLASGTGPPTNFEDWFIYFLWQCIYFYASVSIFLWQCIYFCIYFYDSVSIFMKVYLIVWQCIYIYDSVSIWLQICRIHCHLYLIPCYIKVTTNCSVFLPWCQGTSVALFCGIFGLIVQL